MAPLRAEGRVGTRDPSSANRTPRLGDAGPPERPREAEWRANGRRRSSLLVAWLLGTFPSATLVARAKGRDILHEGSGNPGASNVARLLGWRYGLLVLVIDFAKGAGRGRGRPRRRRAPGRVRARRRRGRRPHVPAVPQGRQGRRGGGRDAGGAVPADRARPRGRVVRRRARCSHKASLASLLIAVLFPVAVALMGYDVVGSRRARARSRSLVIVAPRRQHPHGCSGAKRWTLRPACQRRRRCTRCVRP